MLFQAEWLLRIVCSVAAGILIGLERHRMSKSAGIRTHAIVAMASCLLMLISEYGFADVAKNDPARIAAQVVSGVGFLGAGIIFTQNGSTRGLTTAAGVWATAAIGMAFGVGMYGVAAFCSFLMFIIESVLQKTFSYTPPYSSLRMEIIIDEDASPKQLNDILLKTGYNHTENKVSADKRGWKIETTLNTNKEIYPKQLIEKMKNEENVVDARFL